MTYLDLELFNSESHRPTVFEDFVDTTPFVWAAGRSSYQAGAEHIFPGTVLAKHFENSQCPSEFMFCAPIMGMTGDCVSGGGDTSDAEARGGFDGRAWISPVSGVSFEHYHAGCSLFVAPTSRVRLEYMSRIKRLAEVSHYDSWIRDLSESYQEPPPVGTISVRRRRAPADLMSYPPSMRAPILPEGTEVILPNHLFLECSVEMSKFPVYTPFARDRCIVKMLSLPTEIGVVVFSGFSRARLTQFSKVVWPCGTEAVIDSRVLMWQDDAVQWSVPLRKAPLREEALTNPELF